MRGLVRELLQRGRAPRKPGGCEGGKLASCPRSPNCVSTRSENPTQRMDPVPFEGTVQQTLDRILEILERWPRTRIVRHEGSYVHAECLTSVFEFVDDVEILIDDRERLVHFRSVSRIGFNDLGANRRRMQGFVRELKASGDR